MFQGRHGRNIQFFPSWLKLDETSYWQLVVSRGCKWSLSLCAATLLTLANVQAVERPAAPLTTVADLRYGVVLYEYYQDNYMQALSELLVAQARGGIKGHRENPRVIEGGISLAFGMERKASELFEQLLSNNQQSQSVRNAAWYYLAKLRYLQGNWPGSVEGLAHINGEVTSELDTPLKNLQVNLAIRLGELDTAAQQLQRFDSTDLMFAYHWFNLGNAHSRKGQFSQARSSYQELLNFVDDQFVDTDSGAHQQVLALYDKTLTASGFSLMDEGDHNAAIDRFSLVRQGSYFSSEAMLGYGWAAFHEDDYQLALKPWQKLAQGSMSVPAVQEALLVVPYAYEQLQNSGAALRGYEKAEQRFESEMSRLQRLTASLQDGTVRELLALNTQRHGWLALDQQSYTIAKHVELTQLFSQNRFQVAVQSLQDLLELQEQLTSWQGKLDIFKWTLLERQNGKAQAASLVERQPWRDRLNSLSKARNDLSVRLERIQAQQDYLALAQGATAEYRDRLEKMEANIAFLAASGKSIDEYAPLVKFYRGILLWQAAMDFPDTLWRSQQELRRLDSALADVRRDQQRFEAALLAVKETEDSGASVILLSSIEPLQLRLAAQTKAVGQALFEAEKKLSNQMLDDLEQQQHRLSDYLAQSRLAKARLYDAALNESSP